MEIVEEVADVETQCLSASGQFTLPPLPTGSSAGSRMCGHGGFYVSRAQVYPGPRCIWDPILGYEETIAQPELTWNIMLTFPPRQLQDP